jgi:hypothetical protein
MAGLEVEGVDAVFAPVYAAFNFKDVTGFLHPCLFAKGFGYRLLLVFLVGRAIMGCNAWHYFFEELIHTKRFGSLTHIIHDTTIQF